MGWLDVTATCNGGGASLLVAGDLDTATVHRLRAVVSELDRGLGHLTLDLSALQFVGLSGLRALDEVVTTALARTTAVCVVGMSVLGRRVSRLAGLWNLERACDAGEGPNSDVRMGRAGAMVGAGLEPDGDEAFARLRRHGAGGHRPYLGDVASSIVPEASRRPGH